MRKVQHQLLTRQECLLLLEWYERAYGMGANASASRADAALMHVLRTFVEPTYKRPEPGIMTDAQRFAGILAELREVYDDRKGPRDVVERTRNGAVCEAVLQMLEVLADGAE